MIPVICATIVTAALAQPLSITSGFAPAIDHAIARTVKVYGAQIGTERGYGSGIMVSPDGFVVTVSSLLLKAENLRVVTADGHIYQAEVTYRDDYRQLALLKLARQPDNVDTEASIRIQMARQNFPHFVPENSASLRTGDWILTAGNAFKIAEGEEPVSIMKGVVRGRAPLDAMQGTQPFPYRGKVILVDAISTTVGSPGSALVDLDGQLVGLIGERVTSRKTNTDLSYAYPAEELKAFLIDAQSNHSPKSQPAAASRKEGYHGIRLSKIGYRSRLPFVQSVAAGSPAAEAGVRSDDLIVSANGTAIPRARAFAELSDRLHAGDDLSLMIKRGDDLVSIRFTLTEPPE